MVYVEPLESRRAALGFDVLSDPVRRAALEKARDTGQLAATAALQLVQTSEPEPGFLVAAPIYLRGLPHDTVAERRAALAGYVTGVFMVSESCRLMSTRRDFPLLGVETTPRTTDRRT